VLPATRPDGTRAVLKIQYPHRESAHEAAALAHWGGDGAVRLLDRYPDAHALLIERCEPGQPLSTVDAKEALDVLVELLPRLWKPAGEPFTSLATEAAHWITTLPEQWTAAGRPYERRLLDAAVETLRELSASQGEPVLLHQDLHADNVLRAAREPWLAIDPKPLVGEREFGIAPIVRSAELGHSRAEVRYRFDRLTAELGLDRQRARGWAFAQTLAWAFEDGRILAGHLDVARWLG
jgi:streptomycin 6-kinase